MDSSHCLARCWKHNESSYSPSTCCSGHHIQYLDRAQQPSPQRSHLHSPSPLQRH
uniref:Uncharacterized protein n=1 Tax=Brassica oleracea var. oleracea TaxID=109376 RepID=A0A0D2ZPS0_BRAOL